VLFASTNLSRRTKHQSTDDWSVGCGAAVTCGRSALAVRACLLDVRRSSKQTPQHLHHPHWQEQHDVPDLTNPHMDAPVSHPFQHPQRTFCLLHCSRWCPVLLLLQLRGEPQHEADAKETLPLFPTPAAAAAGGSKRCMARSRCPFGSSYPNSTSADLAHPRAHTPS